MLVIVMDTYRVQFIEVTNAVSLLVELVLPLFFIQPQMIQDRLELQETGKSMLKACHGNNRPSLNPHLEFATRVCRGRRFLWKQRQY